MYNAFFGFKESPFNLTPDPAFLYRSQQHEEALANLIYGVQSRKGFVVLTGEVGTGKTTMLQCLQDFLSAHKIDFAYLFNSRLTVEQFFEMMAYDLDLRCSRNSKTEVLMALNQLLIQNANEGRTTALIVDEAHNLEWDVIEEIRLLGNLENRREKLLQVVLAGQPEFDRKLDAPSLRQVETADCAAVHAAAFQPLRGGGIHRDAACQKPDMREETPFPPEVLDQIHVRSQGIPRLINAICDNLLLTAFAMERKVASVEMVDEVSDDMRLEWPGRRTRHTEPAEPPPGSSLYSRE